MTIHQLLFFSGNAVLSAGMGSNHGARVKISTQTAGVAWGRGGSMRGGGPKNENKKPQKELEGTRMKSIPGIRCKLNFPFPIFCST